MATSDSTSDTRDLFWSLTHSQGKVPLDRIRNASDQASSFFLSSPGLPGTIALDTSSNSNLPSLPQWLDSIRDGYDITYNGPLCENSQCGSSGSVDHLNDTKDTSSLDFQSTLVREASIEPPGGGTGATYNLHGLGKESPEVKLRSASRKPKRTRQRISVAVNVQRARNCHNNIEKKYRARLKQGFERLLAVLYTSMPLTSLIGNESKSLDAGYCYSRGEVLDAAMQRILALEEDNRRLTCRLLELSEALN
ncbi:hypothetical protein HYE68_008835 [Fusarium pseudograminearum]|nr:hypothetical protein HYE68_008835 [Fusarium pseudograminearum]